MHYVSTRDSSRRLTASQAIVEGLSRDGGLYLPESIPQLTLADIRALARLSYPERAAKIMKLQIFHGDAVNENLTFRRFVKTGDQIDERCFSTAGLAHDGHGLSGIDGKGNIVEHRQVSVLILEGNVSELDLSVEAAGMGFGILVIFDLRFGVVKLHDLS